MTDKISTVLESLAQFQAERDEYRARAEAAEADLRYWRESVKFAVDILSRGRAEGQGPLLKAANDAEGYLRQLLGMDGAGWVNLAYRTTEERLATIERRQEEDAATLGEHAHRLADLEARVTTVAAAALTEHGVTLNNDVEIQIDALSKRIDDNAGALQARIAELEHRVQLTEAAWRALGTMTKTRGEHEATILSAYDANDDAGKVTWIDMELLAMLQAMAYRLAKLSDMVR